MTKVKDITFHYTKDEMVKELIPIIPMGIEDSILDAGSGLNKIWFNNFYQKNKFECELEDGCDFLVDWVQKVDWVVGNSPYHLSWKFTEKATQIASKGIAWLINNQALNSHCTPKRVMLMRLRGFYLSKIHVVSDKRWFGRYYFVIYTRKPNDFLTSTMKSF